MGLDVGVTEQPAERGGEAGRAVVPAARRPALPDQVARPVDVALGATAIVLGPAVNAAGAMVRWALPVAGALADAVAHPPLVPTRWAPAEFLGALRRRGTDVRRAAAYDLAVATATTADTAVPLTLELVLSRVDLTEVVLAQVDLGRVVDAALDQVDLTALVTSRVDLPEVVRTALEGLDLTEIVRTQVDLATIADEVIDDVDLPEIIRASTTGVASGAVQGARMSAIGADEQVSRIIDRILLRRRARNTDAPGEVPGERGATEPGGADR